VGGEQVEQQPAGDGHAQPWSCPRGLRVESAVGYGRGERLEPAGHHTFEEAFCTWPAAQGMCVQLEEQPFLRPQSWIAVPCPEPARVFDADRARVPQCGAFGLLDRDSDRGEQSFAGPEVVQQHAVAGADRGGHLAQAQVRDPSLPCHGDSGAEQPVPG
jgi:hypothetical protein